MMQTLKVSKEAQRIIDYNLKVDRQLVDGYILFQNKHLRHDSFKPKMLKLQKLIEQLGGQIEFTGEPNIQGDNRCIKVTIKLQGQTKALLTKIK